MSTVTELSWFERFKNLQREMDSIIAKAHKDAETTKATAARQVSRASAMAANADTRAVNKYESRITALETEVTSLKRKLRHVTYALEECTIPSPHVKNSRQVILAALKEVK